MVIRKSEDDKAGPELQRTVLLYLAENGSTKWGALYSYFYQEKPDEIGLALQDLTQWKHISVELDGATRITASGLGQLNSRP
ncbi:MAG TPA: hypothetical protein VLL06_03120 [Nitrospiraceae bacterium]|nr:hypothetical protein [Nitrospiraceae bacterium]